VAQAASGGGLNPLQQFEIHALVPIHIGPYDISFTNSALWMVLAVVASTLLLTICMRRRALVPGRMQNVAEIMYGIVADVFRENVGNGGRKYFPFIFTLFVFVLFGNMLGLLPGSFTFTSHLIVTFTMASIIFVAVTVIGLARHGLKFFSLFMPHGAPPWTAVILVPIEAVSYLSRPLSLSVRLFANMMVGHTLLKVMGAFVVMVGMFGFVPLAFVVAITALEFLVSALQAYVFAILTCIYLHDALHLH